MYVGSWVHGFANKANIKMGLSWVKTSNKVHPIIKGDVRRNTKHETQRTETKDGTQRTEHKILNTKDRNNGRNTKDRTQR